MFAPEEKCEHGGKCTGSKYCTACKNCKYCKHCNEGGGVCGVCSPESFEEKREAPKPKPKTAPVKKNTGGKKK